MPASASMTASIEFLLLQCEFLINSCETSAHTSKTISVNYAGDLNCFWHDKSDKSFLPQRPPPLFERVGPWTMFELGQRDYVRILILCASRFWPVWSEAWISAFFCWSTHSVLSKKVSNPKVQMLFQSGTVSNWFLTSF